MTPNRQTRDLYPILLTSTKTMNIMKTAYIKPAIEVIKIDSTRLMAGSFDEAFNDEDIVTGGIQVLSNRRRSSVWDDEEE